MIDLPDPKPNQHNWRQFAACADVTKKNPELAQAWDGEDNPFTDYAKDVCVTRCPARMFCLKDALADEEAQGIRGGYEFDFGKLPVAKAREIRDTLNLTVGRHQRTGRSRG